MGKFEQHFISIDPTILFIENPHLNNISIHPFSIHFNYVPFLGYNYNPNIPCSKNSETFPTYSPSNKTLNSRRPTPLA